MGFPLDRLQRYRQTPALRALLSETHLSADDFIMPIFVSESLSEPVPIPSMPGLSQQSLSSLPAEVSDCVSLGIKAIILFGIPSIKDAKGTASYAADGVVQQATRLIKDQFPDLVVIADCCLCEYTDHGHCGVHPRCDGFGFDMDATLDTLSRIAISYAEAGVDIVAPSGMMDGTIVTLRTALDSAGYSQVLLLSYAVKYASAFYGPFRDAAGAGDVFKGDRCHHQLSPTQCREGLREAALDVSEGADMLMVKPGMPYLDMVRALRDRYDHPVVAYQVSGEYAMIHAGIAQGVLPAEAIEESLMAFKRAGSDLIISYFAKQYLKNG